MVTEKFRRQLRQESENWWTEGLINAELYEKLGDRYQFDRLEQEASNRFITILMGLGGILLGLAVITFVAANWQVWPRGLKILLLISLFIGVNGAGFYLWQRPAYQKLGQGLLLLGALILGANLALLSQMFHQSGNTYELLLVWGLGVATMAYSLRLTSLGVLSLLLVSAGYWLGWLQGDSQTDSPLAWIVLHMALIASLLFVPLAYWCRSRVIFALSAILVANALVFNLRPLAGWWAGGFVASGWVVAIAFTLPPALLWSYSRNIWRPTRSPDPFQPTARALAIVFLSLFLTFFAFRWVWEAPFYTPYAPAGVMHGNLQLLVDVCLLSIVTGLGWIQLRHQGRWFQEKAVNSGLVGGLLAIAAALLCLHFEMELAPGWPIILFNVMLFLLAMGLIRDGLSLSQRQTFWGGMVLLVLGILCRTLEYDTGLLLKSIVFAICGVGVILAGLWFERATKPQNPRLATPS